MFQYYNANCYIGSKRKRMGPKTLNNYIVNTSTSDQYNIYLMKIQYSLLQKIISGLIFFITSWM